MLIHLTHFIPHIIHYHLLPFSSTLHFTSREIMSPVPQTKPACVKTPTIKKGPVTSDAAVTTEDTSTGESSGGMMFIFSLPDAETKAYISHDPVFKGVSGYQKSCAFISEDMIEKMTKDTKDIDPNAMVLSKGYSDEDMSHFMYGYADECMEECEGGEVADGTVVVSVYF